ncbi:MAG: hypothetical protein K1W00_06880 [Lachnospiraceae bacterium]
MNRKVVTSVSLFKVAAGQRMSITYSEINEKGEIVKDNVKVARIITDNTTLDNINTVLLDAQSIVNTIEE